MKVTKEIIIEGCERARRPDQDFCKKQAVYAMIVLGNVKFFGSNWILKDSIEECSRMSMKSGTGYEYCKDQCHQENHAETAAIKEATDMGVELDGGILYLTGHTYCCDSCLDKMKDVGIVKVYCIDSGKEYGLLDTD